MNPDIVFENVSSASGVVRSLFNRKFNADPPGNDWPYHLCAFWHSAPGHLKLVAYAHFGRFGDTCLVGGMCTDGNMIREMPAALRDEVTAHGGICVHLLRFGFREFAGKFDAFYGLVEDSRALEVDLAAGFVKTEHNKLVRYLPKPLDAKHVACLDAKVLTLGAF
jgi:hypothetical protein